MDQIKRKENGAKVPIYICCRRINIVEDILTIHFINPGYSVPASSKVAEQTVSSTVIFLLRGYETAGLDTNVGGQDLVFQVIASIILRPMGDMVFSRWIQFDSSSFRRSSASSLSV